MQNWNGMRKERNVNDIQEKVTFMQKCEGEDVDMKTGVVERDSTSLEVDLIEKNSKLLKWATRCARAQACSAPPHPRTRGLSSS